MVIKPLSETLLMILVIGHWSLGDVSAVG